MLYILLRINIVMIIYTINTVITINIVNRKDGMVYAKVIDCDLSGMMIAHVIDYQNDHILSLFYSFK